LAEHLYGVADTVDSNAIEAIVARLRRKFGPDIITTRRRFGYLLETDT
jgi:two component transcriptional regulator, winged helix family